MRNGSSPEALLKVRGLNAGYDAGPVLFGIELDVAPSELIALVGANMRRDREIRDDVARVLDHFPALKDKLTREAGTLSGGEQQMVAIGRGMMARPKLLMVDELSLGLAPNVVDRLVDVIQQINREGTALLLVEQDVLVALDVANRAYVLENGRVALSGAAADVKDDPGVRRAYLGL